MFPPVLTQFIENKRACKEEWFARLDWLANIIGENFFDEARDFRVDVCDLRFVVCDSTDCSDLLHERFHFGRRGFHTDQLLSFRSNVDLANT